MRAWELLTDVNKQFDLVLTDVMMPGLNGMKLLAKIMAAEAHKNLPVISEKLSLSLSLSLSLPLSLSLSLSRMHEETIENYASLQVLISSFLSFFLSAPSVMSSQDSVDLVLKCFQNGAADFLVKPVRKNELKNLWQHAWRKANSVRHLLSLLALPL